MVLVTAECQTQTHLQRWSMHRWTVGLLCIELWGTNSSVYNVELCIIKLDQSVILIVFTYRNSLATLKPDGRRMVPRKEKFTPFGTDRRSTLSLADLFPFHHILLEYTL